MAGHDRSYTGGSSSTGGDVGRDNVSNNNSFTDPFATRNVFKREDAYGSKDPYKTHDPYRLHDPYALNDPYENRGDGGSKPFVFWFALKEMLQEMFSADLALHEEKRVYAIDKDLFRVQFFMKMFGRTMNAVFFGFLIVVASFLIAIPIIPEYKVIIAFFDILIIIWFLYFPAHQTITSGEYAISTNTIEFYKRWRSSFNSYQVQVLITYVAALVTCGAFAFYPAAFQAVAQYINYSYHPKDAVQAFYFIGGVHLFFLMLYLFYVNKLEAKMQVERKKNYQVNVISRKQSEAEKVQDMLDQ